MLYTINYIRLWLKGKKMYGAICSIWEGRKVYYAEYILYSKRSPIGEGLLYSKSSGGLIYYGGRFTLWHMFPVKSKLKTIQVVSYKNTRSLSKLSIRTTTYNNLAHYELEQVVDHINWLIDSCLTSSEQ